MACVASQQEGCGCIDLEDLLGPVQIHSKAFQLALFLPVNTPPLAFCLIGQLR